MSELTSFLIAEFYAKTTDYGLNDFERSLVNECVDTWTKKPHSDPRRNGDGIGQLAIPVMLGQTQIITNMEYQAERMNKAYKAEVARLTEQINKHSHYNGPGPTAPPAAGISAEWIPLESKDSTKLVVEVTTAFDITRYPHHCQKCGAPSYRGLVKEDCVNKSCSNFTP